jgi:aminoglycoside phosphotransferase (APT) family kinase protein
MTPQPTDDAPALGLDLEIGPKLASGRDADVFDLGNGRVLRRYRNGRTSEAEAEIMRHARAHGYPAPAVYEVSGPDMVMERVDGPTMMKDLGKRPWMLWRHARLLAKLHRQLATIPPLDWLKPFPPDEPGIESTGSRAGGSLLHLDLHPDNVMLSAHGPVAIDWSSAKRGDVASAVALTWVIMATSEIPDTGLQRRLFDLFRRLLVAEFLRHVDRPAVLKQLPAVARFRLGDRNLLPSERPAIDALVRRNGFTA